MAFNLIKVKPRKGDIVITSEDPTPITYIMGDEKDGHATIYGIGLSEAHDDIIIMDRRVPLNTISLAKESIYNQIGYLMRLRHLVIHNEYFFSFPWSKNNGDQ